MQFGASPSSSEKISERSTVRVVFAAGSFTWMTRAAPGLGSIRKMSSSGSGLFDENASFGGRLKMTRISVSRTGSALPARMGNGTPDQRQLSISRRRAANVSVCSPASPLAPIGTRRTGHGRSAWDQSTAPWFTSTRLSRCPSASGVLGGSDANSPTSCSRWFCTTSRSAPTGS